MISPENRSASAMPSALLPEAVGPSTATTGGRTAEWYLEALPQEVHPEPCSGRLNLRPYVEYITSCRQGRLRPRTRDGNPDHPPTVAVGRVAVPRSVRSAAPCPAADGRR